MIRAVLGLLAGAAAAGPGLAAEGGAIRGGEHAGFSRIVMTVEPATEWSLETGAGSATIFFPGKALDFDTAGTFEKLPKTRIGAVEAMVDDRGTTVRVAIGCDCRISTAFVGAQYLALDVSDRGVAPTAEPPPPVVPIEDRATRETREATIVASAEQILLRQIEHAASQGLIKLADPAEKPKPAAAEAVEAPEAVATADPAAHQQVVAVDPPAPPDAPVPGPAPVLPLPEAGEAQPMLVAGLAVTEQVEARTVFDRDGALVARRMAEPVRPPACLPDERLDIGGWSNGTPLFAQQPGFARRLTGEFDAPDPEAIGGLARLYLRFGFGAESAALIRSFPGVLPDEALLLDLAATLEGRTEVAGPLAAAAPCPDRHGLWQALAGAAPLGDATQFVTVLEAFGELPADLRAALGPTLVGRLLDAGRSAEARLIHETAIRPGTEPSAEIRLAQARLDAAEGRPAEAIAALAALVDGNAPNAAAALRRLVRLAVDNGLPVPDRMIVDLQAAVLNQRDAGATELRALLAEALAGRGELGAAIAAVREAEAEDPGAGLDGLAAAILAGADPATVGPAAYAETVLARADMIGAGPDEDGARREIAQRLLDLGLPDAALELLGPPLSRGDPAARLQAAVAELRLGRADAARAAIEGMAGPEAAGLRARAAAHEGDFAGAVAVLTAEGLANEAADYAWPSGDWPFALDRAELPDRLAMAAYMAGRTGAAPPPAPAEDPAALDPVAAFVEPLPLLETPSLSAARRLIATGRQIGGFVEDVLAAP